MDLIVEKGHYVDPIKNSRCYVFDISNNAIQVTLTVTQSTSTRKIAMKHHGQFTSSTANKFIKLVDSAGKESKNNIKLKDDINRVTIKM